MVRCNVQSSRSQVAEHVFAALAQMAQSQTGRLRLLNERAHVRPAADLRCRERLETCEHGTNPAGFDKSKIPLGCVYSLLRVGGF